MTRLPVVSFRTMEKMLRHPGFGCVRQRGSHVFYRHPNGRTATVPHHSGKDLARPLIRELLRQIELTSEQFRRELKKI